jgi:hypothetical protein
MCELTIHFANVTNVQRRLANVTNYVRISLKKKLAMMESKSH